MDRCVVITGIGVVTPIGIGIEEMWNNLLTGKSGAEKVASFDTSGLRNHIGCEVKEFRPEKYMDRPNGFGRATQFAIAASKMALEDAGLLSNGFDSESFGVTIGTTMGEPQIIEEIGPRWSGLTISNLPSEKLQECLCQAISVNVGHELGLIGPNVMIPAACAAGNYAIGYGFDTIQAGDADRMLVGGTDAFSRIAFLGFSRLLIMAPERCQPFDRRRKGLLVGEGAAMLVLEDLASAKKRGARIYAQVLGYGLSCDAHHIAAPHPFGEGATRAMARALQSSCISSHQVDYINAHGTGTPQNDRIETLAIKKVFGERAYRIPISSIKALLGHSMGAASAIEAAACALALEQGIVPPTWNLEEPDPDCDLDYVPNEPRERQVGIVINNAYGFGGNNATVVFRRV
jgi:3-oxoacyl-[acyl-carrier-protein] synthase II